MDVDDAFGGFDSVVLGNLLHKNEVRARLLLHRHHRQHRPTGSAVHVSPARVSVAPGGAQEGGTDGLLGQAQRGGRRRRGLQFLLRREGLTYLRSSLLIFFTPFPPLLHLLRLLPLSLMLSLRYPRNLTYSQS